MTQPQWQQNYNARRRAERAFLKENDPEEYRRKYLQPLKKRRVCEVLGCADEARNAHSSKCENHKSSCVIEGCARTTNNNAKYCGGHSARIHGNSRHIPIDVPLGQRPRISEWAVGPDGYVRRSRKGKTEAQHRVAVQEHIGRELFRHENVHHKNGQRADNRIENLELWSTSQPAGQRVEDKLAWCVEFLEEYIGPLPEDIHEKIDKALRA